MCPALTLTEIGAHNYQDHWGVKAFSNRKAGKVVAEALAASGHKERICITPERLAGEALTV